MTEHDPTEVPVLLSRSRQECEAWWKEISQKQWTNDEIVVEAVKKYEWQESLQKQE